MLFLASTPKGDDDQDWYSITMADPTWWCGSMLGPVSGHSSLSAVNCPIMKIMVIIITTTTSAVIMMMKLMMGLFHIGFLHLARMGRLSLILIASKYSRCQIDLLSP